MSASNVLRAIVEHLSRSGAASQRPTPTTVVRAVTTAVGLAGYLQGTAPMSVDTAWSRAAIVGSAAFHGIASAAADDLCRRVVRCRFDEGQTVIAADETPDRAFLVVVGRVDAIARHGARVATLATARAGDLFGDEQPHQVYFPVATWVVAEPTIALALSRDDLASHLARHPSTALFLIRSLAKRTRQAEAMIVHLSSASMDERVEAVLVELSRSDGFSVPRGVELRRCPTQQDLANRIGTSRETVSRIFTRLIRDGLLVRRGHHLLVTHAFLARR
jgi:CRP-like cAMP-binding protein